MPVKNLHDVDLSDLQGEIKRRGRLFESLQQKRLLLMQTIAEIEADQRKLGFKQSYVRQITPSIAAVNGQSERKVTLLVALQAGTKKGKEYHLNDLVEVASANGFVSRNTKPKVGLSVALSTQPQIKKMFKALGNGRYRRK